jgi:hypothetical protein
VNKFETREFDPAGYKQNVADLAEYFETARAKSDNDPAVLAEAW